MKEIFANPDFTLVGYFKSILDEAEIPNFVRNGTAASTSGMTSPPFHPTLCITQDSDYDRAIELLEPLHRNPEASESHPWKCATCAEENPANFGACWNCGSDRIGDGGE